MKVGIIGTGAISAKHALAYQNIGYRIAVCTDHTEAKGKAFADQVGAQFVASAAEVCAHPEVDFVDLCTLPGYRLPAVQMCAAHRKHILVQKPMAVDLATASRMIEIARHAGVQLGVVSQHRFDDSVLFLRQAIAEGRLGRILEADAYVKWHRTAEYYARPVKGTWAGEGGGALISQAIHQVDLLLHMIGPVEEVSGQWRLGATHSIESEDMVNALLRYSSGALGVIQASTSFRPGASERIEIHGTKGVAILTGDQLTTWDVEGDSGDQVPLARPRASGASDPMAISIAPIERQLQDFGDSCREGRSPFCSGEDGYRALQLVRAIYASCAERRPVRINDTVR